MAFADGENLDFTVEYDAEGHVERVIPSGEYYYKYSYNTEGKLILREEIRKLNDTLYSSIDITYNGNIITHTRTQGASIQTWEYTYTDGLLITIKNFESIAKTPENPEGWRYTITNTYTDGKLPEVLVLEVKLTPPT